MYLCNKFVPVIGTRGNLQYFCYINSKCILHTKPTLGKISLDCKLDPFISM